MIDYYETRSQPITRLMVWQAYRKVKANKGSAGIDGMDWALLDSNLKPSLYKPFERYADDIVVHCKTEGQADYVLEAIQHRFTSCRLSLHPEKSKIVCIRGTSRKKYPKSYDFLGFTVRATWCKLREGFVLIPSTFISRKSINSVVEKFRTMQIHKRRKQIEELARQLNPVIGGVINYYCKKWAGHTRCIWKILNMRLRKWVKWERRLYKRSSARWLKNK